MVIIKKSKQKSVLILTAAIVALVVNLSSPAQAAETLRIMPLGDSITRGYFGGNSNGYRKNLYLDLINTGLEIDFVGGETDGDFADPDHEGYDSQTASWLNADMSNRLSNYLPDCILYHIGTNDLINGSDIETYAQDAEDTIEIIYNFDPNTTIILAKIILTSNDEIVNTRIRAYNLLLGDIVQAWADAGYSIADANMTDALDYSMNMSSWLHPNDSGYARIANVWYDALENVLDFTPEITSSPVTNAAVGRLYTYDVEASGEPDPTYSLAVYPAGMTIDPNTGLIEWAPVDYDFVDVTVQAGNGLPPDVSQNFIITVAATIEFDAASFVSSSENNGTLSWSHTVGNGQNRLLVVGVAGEDNNAGDLIIADVEYNNIAMIPVTDSNEIAGSGIGQDRKIQTKLYYMLSPPSGTAAVEVTFSGNVSDKYAGAVSIENVQQQQPEAVATNANADANSISTAITTQTDGAWIVDVIACGNQGSFTVATGGMQEQWVLLGSSSSSAGSTRPAILAGTTAMSWNHTDANRLVHSAAAFVPKQPITYDIIDLILLIEQWLNPDVTGDPDYSGDGKIDFDDFARLSEDWHAGEF